MVADKRPLPQLLAVQVLSGHAYRLLWPCHGMGLARPQNGDVELASNREHHTLLQGRTVHPKTAAASGGLNDMACLACCAYACNGWYAHRACGRYT
jgi:hypothetical protein